MEQNKILINYEYYKIPKTLKELKRLEPFLFYIDQPVNAQLSNLLQLVCATTKSSEPVAYLLSKGANPYYMDIHGKTAYDYASENEFNIKHWLINLLDKYRRNFQPVNYKERENLIQQFIQIQITKHIMNEKFDSILLAKDLDELNTKELPNDNKE